MNTSLNRRCALKLLTAAAALPLLRLDAKAAAKQRPWKTAVGLNGFESGIRKYKKNYPIWEILDFASRTGFDGVARYRRTLPLPPERVARVRIEFAAVTTHATVFCNGKEVGQHLGGWTPFRVDVTDALLWNGNDVLEVRVDELVGHNTQGFLPIVQPHFGGIWQDVTLCLDKAPVFDRLGLFLFGAADGEQGQRDQ